MKNCTPLWREAHFKVKMLKTPHARTTFWRSNVEKVHGVVAQSTSPSQNVQNATCTDHCWKMRCCKSARRCGARHISKSKCTRHTMFGPLLEGEMLKKCTPLWREARFQVKNVKKKTDGPGPLLKVVRRCGAKHISESKCTKRHMVWTTFDGWGVAGARDCAPCQKWANHESFVAVSTTPTTTIRYTTVGYTTNTPLHYTTLHPHYTTLHYTTLHYITLHYATLHYTSLHYTTVYFTTKHSTTLHYTRLHYTTLHYITLHYTTLHNAPYTPLHYTILHYTTLGYTTLHNTPLHYTTLHSTTLHSTTLHYTTLHYTTLRYPQLHYTTLHLQLQPQLQLRYFTLHYTRLHYIAAPYITLHQTHYTSTI